MTVSGGVGNPHVKVDTLCDHWHVTVTDIVPLASATLIDDPFGDVYGKPGKEYFNTRFDEKNDPNHTNEIIFNGSDMSVSFDVNIVNSLDTAYAPIIIYDKNGFFYKPVIELRHVPPALTQLAEFSAVPLVYKKMDTLNYGISRAGSGNQICSTIVIINKAPKGSVPFTLDSAYFLSNHSQSTKYYTLSTVLPTTLKGGDTMKIDVCFNSPSDTGLFKDTVVIGSSFNCLHSPQPVLAQTGTPIIYATDWDFGQVAVGTSACHTVTVINQGNMPFTLTKQWLLHDKVNFSMDPGSASALPVVLQPHQSVKLTFCYSPTKLDAGDSTTNDWKTDIDAPYTNQIKSWSFLRGTPVKPGLKWDRQTQLDSVICE